MKSVFIVSAALLSSVCAGAATVSGTVRDTEGNPLSGVQVSDGFAIVLTDKDGRYTMSTDKKAGMVYLSTPSGYSPATYNVNLPQFWQLVTSPADEDETADFVLAKNDDSRFAFIAFADNQISNRHGEVTCFNTTTVPDINASLDSLRAEGYNPFLIALGDQAHDCYWRPNRYGLPEAYSDLRKLDAPLYSVMGNHDNDNTAMNDFDAAGEWRRHVGPNYYSFDKGGVHFVVLDNIEIVDNSPNLSKDGECVYKNRIAAHQMEWLKKDLSYVKDRSKPLVVAMHAPLYYFPGGSKKYYIENGEELSEILSAFDDVRVLSGHTHVSYATASEDGKIYENNYGAVCGSWWLNARVDLGNDNNICRDGTPSGYAVWKWNDGAFSDLFKGTGMPAGIQFRAYDLNEVEFDNDEIAAEYIRGRKKQNEVLVNVWGYGPGWKVEMFEKGKPLKVERVRSKDPLFLLSCPIPYLEQGNKLVGTVRPVFTMHLFKAKARSGKSPVEIRVTDREGRVYKSVLQRPAPLTTAMY
ncbi:MAG: calcineurin-like phosphoesterase C-terminal domain-containing protein [Muribaculaceae bacterium]|nr:calcineurin-like phosphoesterase C-terminal domain-containing protein [Muribaculaceae bacterium]